MLIAMMGVVFAAMAETAMSSYLVYDYSASIKRVDLSLKYRSKYPAYTQAFNVKSDTIRGYILVPTCTTCANGPLLSTFDEDNVGYAYLMLKGVSKTVSEERVVMKVPVKIKSAIFGAEMICAEGQPLSAPSKAHMSLMFKFTEPGELPADLDAAKLNKRLKDLLGNNLFNGFFGPEHYGDVDFIRATGFGTCRVFNKTTAAIIGICGGVPGTSKGCTVINQVSGTLVGYPTYEGACGNIPMWDGCLNEFEDAKYNGINDAVISGTWTVKYNKSLSEKEDKEAEILKKLGVKQENVYEIVD